MDLETIQKRIELIEKHEQEMRNAKELLDGELENSPEYLEAVEEAKVIIEKKKRIKEEILAKGPNQKLAEGIKENSEEVSTLREILSTELSQLFKSSETDEVRGSGGELRKFKVTGKLLPKKGKFKDRNDIGQFSGEEE
jgi:CRISPR/Cas system-associated endonuclease Cas1